MGIQDSGSRRKFDSGAVRDIAEGKGRCDLLPLDIVSGMFDGEYKNILFRIDEFIKTRNTVHIYIAIDTFNKLREWDLLTAILELSIHYEQGCVKYGERNWEKGIPLHCYIDSGLRHYLKWVRGDNDEPHDRAFLWNMFGALWTLAHRPDLDDLPKGENYEGELQS